MLSHPKLAILFALSVLIVLVVVVVVVVVVVADVVHENLNMTTPASGA